MKANGLVSIERVRMNFEDAIAISYFILVLTPYFYQNHLFAVAFTGSLWMIWVGIKLIIRSAKKIKLELDSIITVVFLIVWLLWTFFLKIIGFSTAEWGNYLIRGFFWLPLFMFIYYKNKSNKLKFFSVLIIIIITLNIIDNIFLDIKYPGIMPVITANWASKYWTLNFAKTSFIFVTLVYALYAFSVMLKSNSVAWKAFLFLLLILSSWLIYISGRATHFLLLIGALPLLFLISKVPNNHQKVRVIMITLFLSIVFLFSLSFIESLVPLINNDRIETRLYALIDFNSYELQEYVYRFKLISMSLNSWLKNLTTFIFGNGFSQSANASFTGIGQHSGFIDLLAYYGLVGFLIEMTINYNFIKLSIKRSMNQKLIPVYFVFILTCGLYNVLNNFYSLDIAVVVYILIPTILLTNKENTL